MWEWIMSRLTAPIIQGALDAWRLKLESVNTLDAHAVEVAKATLIAEIEARKSADAIIIAEQGRWWTALPRAIVQWSFALWIAKCVLWDTTLGLGTTEPLRGDLQTWAGWVMMLWFGGRSLEKIASTIWRR